MTTLIGGAVVGAVLLGAWCCLGRNLFPNDAIMITSGAAIAGAITGAV